MQKSAPTKSRSEQIGEVVISSITRQPKRRLIEAIPTEYETNWRSWKFWRNAFIIYWVGSLIGHLLELGWVNLPLLVGNPPTNVLPVFVVAAPYGLGALGLIWILSSSVKRGRITAFQVFLLSVVIGGVVEFACAAAIVSVIGYNPYWDYSTEPFNLMGYICLKNCLAFGLASLPCIYWVLPILNNQIHWLDRHYQKLLNAATLIVFVLYVIIQIMVMSGNPPAKVFHLDRPYFDPANVCQNKLPCPPPKH